MKATDIGELAVALLAFLDQRKIDGADKIAALRAAAAILDQVQAQEAYQQAMAAHIANTYGNRK